MSMSKLTTFNFFWVLYLSLNVTASTYLPRFNTFFYILEWYILDSVQVVVVVIIVIIILSEERLARIIAPMTPHL